MTFLLDGRVIPPTRLAGVPYWFTDQVGWYDTPQDKSPVNEKKQGHGAFAVAKSYREALAISLHVVVAAATEADMLAAVEDLTSIGFDGPVPVRYTDANRVTERVVSVRAVPVKDHHGQPTGEVDIDMIARDPRRYSVDDSWVRADPPSQSAGLVWPVVWPAKWPGGVGSDGRVTLTNLGKKASDPVYRVAGGFDAFTLVNVADQSQVGFQAPFPVPVGSVVEVNFAARTAFMDDTADVTRWLFPRQWWTVPKEASVTCQLEVTAPVGSPFYEGRVRSAW